MKKEYDYIVAASDLHIHSRVPENRKGDYFGQVITKFGHLLEIVNKWSSPKILIVAGDFFDAANVPYKVTRLVMEMIKNSGVKILVVPGQHDLRYHVGELSNTPLGILETAGVVEILTPKRSKTTWGGCTFVGAGWNEEPEEEANILVMHRMITKKGELWPGQTNYSSAHAIMRKYHWADCIISGDNHLPHALRIKGGIDGHRLQVNCGSMVRSTKTQIDFEPRVYLIDVFKWTSKSIKIPIEPPENVFDFNKITIAEMKKEMKKESQENISKFIDTLTEDSKERPNFPKILNNIVVQLKPKKRVQDIINSTMERVS